MNTIEINEIEDWFKDLQNRICTGLEELDGSSFYQDLWKRDGGGGGITRVIRGNVIEKGGVNFSAVHGELPKKIKTKLNLQGNKFHATGVSIVLHPKNPWLPIIHMNVRYFEIANDQYWFGGGIDVTPHYVNDADAKKFHLQLKDICDKHDQTYYPKFKEWADEYFYIKHRNEARGISGIFFDRLNNTENATKNDIWNFVQDVGNAFVPIYVEQVKDKIKLPFSETELEWQRLRRSRYVEFNLVLDKGTKFGLDTNGRTESILMSMPPEAKWLYNYEPEKNTKEYETLAKLKKGIDWLNM